MDQLTQLVDLGGTFVFAISGATTAIRRRMDIFGVMILSFAAGTVGGITRDLLLGAVPPAAISSLSYLAVSVFAGLFGFFRYPLIERLRHPVQWLDAIGLAFFAVAGTSKALNHGLHPVMAALLGMVTGIGGGILRDVLAGKVPVVLTDDIYAMAALSGAALVAGGHVLQLHPLVGALGGGGLCFALRFVAIQHGWRLPSARVPGEDSAETHDPDRRDGNQDDRGA